MGNCYDIDMKAVNRAENSIDDILQHSKVDYTCKGKYTNEQVKCALREEYYGIRSKNSNNFVLSGDYKNCYSGTFNH